MAKAKSRKVEKKEQKSVRIAIRQVKDIAFRVNEELYNPSHSKMEVGIDFQYKMRFSVDVNLLNFTLRTFYYYKGESKDKILADIEVDNLFYVENMKDFIINEELGLHINVWIAIVGMAISHSRALMMKNIAPTLYKDTIVPIVDPQIMAKAFFEKRDNTEEKKLNAS